MFFWISVELDQRRRQLEVGHQRCTVFFAMATASAHMVEMAMREKNLISLRDVIDWVLLSLDQRIQGILQPGIDQDDLALGRGNFERCMSMPGQGRALVGSHRA